MQPTNHDESRPFLSSIPETLAALLTPVTSVLSEVINQIESFQSRTVFTGAKKY